MRRGLAAIALPALLMMGAAAMAQPADSRVSPLDPHGWVFGGWPSLVKALEPDAPALARFQGTGVGQSLAMAGREDLVSYDLPGRPPARSACKPFLRDGKPVEPVAYIAAAARDGRVTMINESHAEPVTRQFIAKAAAALRPLGYDAYAAETFNATTGEKSPVVPLATDGDYTKDAIYGRLFRSLRVLDYRLLPYEADMRRIDRTLPMRDQVQARETMQAANLAAQVARQAGKILVHVGHDHNMENLSPSGIKPMALVFTETTGIDPLTIDTVSQEAPDGVPVVCDPAASYVPAKRFDIRIGMPKLVFERGRPRWRLEAGDHFAEIPAFLRRPDQTAVYEARPAGERGDSTPMDRLLLRPGETLPLLLPAGRYDVSVWTEKDGWSAIVPLAVAAD